MADKLQLEQKDRIQNVINDIDAAIGKDKHNIVDVLNALSMLSISISVRLNLDKETYLNDLSIMFDERLAAENAQKPGEHIHE